MEQHRALIERIFGTSAVEICRHRLSIGPRSYPIVDGVIDLTGGAPLQGDEQIRKTFGSEWTRYDKILPEHVDEFSQYFDLVSLNELADSTCVDLGCGMGRWSYFLAPHVKQLVAVDFSDAIFVARRVLESKSNVLCIRGDILSLPFVDEAFDFGFSLGVLHHLPLQCLEATRKLSRLTPSLLVYLYYALDNRPPHYRMLFGAVDRLRRMLANIDDASSRELITKVGARGLYLPLVRLGEGVARIRPDWGSHIPLYDGYRGQSVGRMEQDFYDRFFTTIEQRVTRKEIESLADDGTEVKVSEGVPYWHFLLRRHSAELAG